MYFQQGDVVLVPAEIPENAKDLDSNVLQEGEHTGHAHRLDHDGAFSILEQPKTKEKFLRVVTPTMLRHEEHKAFLVPAGDYHVRIVREYDHFNEEARRVAD